jgi:hypothetical protein
MLWRPSSLFKPCDVDKGYEYAVVSLQALQPGQGYEHGPAVQFAPGFFTDLDLDLDWAGCGTRVGPRRFALRHVTHNHLTFGRCLRDGLSALRPGQGYEYGPTVQFNWASSQTFVLWLTGFWGGHASGKAIEPFQALGLGTWIKARVCPSAFTSLGTLTRGRIPLRFRKPCDVDKGYEYVLVPSRASGPRRGGRIPLRFPQAL